MTDRAWAKHGVSLALASLAVLGSAVASFAQYRTFESVEHAFRAICLPELTTGDMMALEGTQRFTDQQRRELLANIGQFASPQIRDVFGFYLQDGTAMFYLDERDTALCQLQSFSDREPEALSSTWSAITSEGYRQAGNGLQSRDMSKSSPPVTILGGWATAPVEGGFRQVSLKHMTFHNQPEDIQLLMITAMRVGNAPASCELWPEECK